MQCVDESRLNGSSGQVQATMAGQWQYTSTGKYQGAIFDDLVSHYDLEAMIKDDPVIMT